VKEKVGHEKVGVRIQVLRGGVGSCCQWINSFIPFQHEPRWCRSATQAAAQTRLGPTEAAVLFSLEPVVAAFLSVFWLKESMTPQQVLGGALIVLAMIVSEALPRMFRAITVPDTRP